MTKLKIAVQKSGRLNEDSLQLLKECGISIDNYKDQLSVEARNFPIEVIYLRNSDIPQYVQDSIVDCAILGENTVFESDTNINKILNLGFAGCRLSLAFPKDSSINEIEDIKGKRIATSYPNTLKALLNQYNVNADIHIINGSVEIAPSLGLADGIFDIVSSGSTLFKNGLSEKFRLMKSEAALFTATSLSQEKLQILDQLTFRIKSVLASKNNKYVLLNAPEEKIQEISALLPGMKSPTVMPLAEKGWYSMHSVINENDFWNVIDELKAKGAQGILVIPIEKMIL